MAEVFISYRHGSPDEQLAPGELSKYLSTNGVTHFLDTDLRVGEEWGAVIERELRAAKSFVVVEHSISDSPNGILSLVWWKDERQLLDLEDET